IRARIRPYAGSRNQDRNVMVVRAHDEKHAPAPIRVTIDFEAAVYRQLEQSLADNPLTTEQVAAILLAGFAASVLERLPEAGEKRDEINAFLNSAEIELHIVDHDAEPMPTRDELLALSPEERRPYLEQAAAALENEYRSDPELTITADA